MGLDLVVWRDTEGQLHCLPDHCPHRSARLSAGKVQGDEIECPFHGFRFDGDGQCTAAPCEGDDAHLAHIRADSFPLQEFKGMIWMWWGEGEPSGEPPWFDELGEGMPYSSLSDEWDTSYVRVVENQLDWAHVPFVHHNSIGIAFPQQIEIESRVEGDEIFTWPKHMEAEDGEPSFYLRFRFPNIWMNPGGPKSFVFLAFAPIDETRTKIYVRSYQYLTRVPGLRWLYGRVMNLANRFVIAQDRRVVATQPASRDELPRPEKLVPADLPIAQYRKELARRSAPPDPPRLVQLRLDRPA